MLNVNGSNKVGWIIRYVYIDYNEQKKLRFV
jgi:hypothetical protein